MNRYHNKVAVVTGAAQGIGEAITRALLAEGAAVVLLDLDAELLGRRADELGDRCDFVVGDVTRTDDLGEMVRRAVERFGALDVAFNVAGWARVSSFIATPEAVWERTLDICLKGVFLGMQHEARQMITSGVGGAIVNVASMNSTVPMSGGASYCAAKAGVDMLSRCGAIEFAEHGIRVNTLSPGLVETQMTQFILGDRERSRILTDRIPAGRSASPAEIANAALFLGSDDAAYVSGTNLFVDGAWQHAAYPDMRAMAE